MLSCAKGMEQARGSDFQRGAGALLRCTMLGEGCSLRLGLQEGTSSLAQE